MNMENYRFAESHEWVRVVEEGGDKVATIGISAHAVETLTDLVYMDLPENGDSVTAGESFGEVESVKATSDLFSPISGEIIAVNSTLPDNLEILNDDPYEAGWIIKVKLSGEDGLDKLMTHEAYEKMCSE